MTSKILLSVALIFNYLSVSHAQDQSAMYRRSSLSMILIESDKFPDKDAVLDSWDAYPFSDKYNKHNIETKVINIDAIILSDKELKSSGFLDTLKNPIQINKAKVMSRELKYLDKEKTMAIEYPSEKEAFQLKLNKLGLD